MMYFLYLQIALVDPGKYRQINELLQAELKGKGQVEIMNLREKEEGDEKFQNTGEFTIKRFSSLRFIHRNN